MQFHAPSAEGLARADVSVLTITGHYDDTQLGALYHHQRLMNKAAEATKARSNLLIGPWDHYGTETGEPRVGGLKFGSAAGVDLWELREQWYAWLLRGEPKPAMLTDPVVYYITGDEEWRGAASLDAITDTVRTYYLASEAGTGDVFHSGRLSDAPEAGAEYEFVADPANDHTIRLESLKRPDEYPGVPFMPQTYNSLYMTSNGHDPTNGIFTTDLEGEGVVYHSAPLAGYLRIVGRPSLRLRMAVDVPDADVVVLLHEVCPDGSVVFLSSDTLRLRFRNLPEQPCFISPGEPFDVSFHRFRFIARTLNAGSRLRLTVRNAYSLLLEKNPHTDGSGEAGDVRRPARFKLIHDRDRPSALEIPVLDLSAGTRHG
jgi:hypothetical protein